MSRSYFRLSAVQWNCKEALHRFRIQLIPFIDACLVPLLSYPALTSTSAVTQHNLKTPQKYFFIFIKNDWIDKFISAYDELKNNDM